jgi:hypothetical protein
MAGDMCEAVWRRSGLCWRSRLGGDDHIDLLASWIGELAVLWMRETEPEGDGDGDTEPTACNGHTESLALGRILLTPSSPSSLPPSSGSRRSRQRRPLGRQARRHRRDHRPQPCSDRRPHHLGPPPADPLPQPHPHPLHPRFPAPRGRLGPHQEGH